MAKKLSKSKRLLAEAEAEVHRNIPSTVERAQHFGPGGKEAMLSAIAFSKARKRGATLPKKKGRGKI